MSRVLPIVLIAVSLLLTVPALSQLTPPIMPTVQETTLPPLVCLPAPPSVPNDVPNRPLTAAEAAQIALHHQPNINVAAQGVVAAQGARIQAQSGLLPSVGAAAGYNNLLATNTSNQAAGLIVPGYSAAITLSQLLFNFNHTRDEVRAAEAQQQAAGANLTRTSSTWCCK